MASKKLLLVPAVVVTLLVPAGDATARKKSHGKSWAAPGQVRADDVRPAGVGDGRRMR
jgi:hypothetical protein